MSLLIQNITIVNEEGIFLPADILIEGGIITDIKPGLTVPGAEIIGGSGLHAFPGFVDLHSHLRDPGLTHKEDIMTGTRAAAAGGFVKVCAMPNTVPVTDNAEILSYIKGQAQKAGYADVLPVASITQGMEGKYLTDFKALKKAGAVAFSDDGLPVADEKVLHKAMVQAKKTDALLMLHEEDLEVRGEGVANAGANAEKAGLPGIPAETEESLTARDIAIAEQTGARVHICHVSTAGSVWLVRNAKKRGVDITCETGPHYFSLDDSVLLKRSANTKVNPPIRSKADVAAIIEGLCDGTIDAIATDHAPHSEEEKSKDFILAPFGLIGFETAFALAITHLHVGRGIPLFDIARWLSAAPCRILGIRGGRIMVGEPANITLCDVSHTYIYLKENIISKSKNSPFIEEKLTGSVKMTIRDGSIIYDHRQANR